MTTSMIEQVEITPAATTNPVNVYIARLPSEGAQYTMARSLETVARLVSGGKVLARDFAWEKMRYVHVNATRAELMRVYAPATANKHLAALRGVLETCRRLGLISADECAQALDGAKRVPGSRVRERHLITPDDLGKMIAACVADVDGAGKREKGRRDAALLTVLYSAGLRRGEAAGLTTSDFVSDNTLGVRIVVHKAKGNKEREIPLHPSAASAIVDWLSVRGTTSGPMFCHIGKGGRVQAAKPMSGASILLVVRERVMQAGLDPAIKTHDMRSSWITELWRRGADGPTIADLAGHASVVTTAGYRLQSDEDKRGAIALLDVPYEKE